MSASNTTGEGSTALPGTGNRTNSPRIPELLPDLDPHVEFQVATGVEEGHPDFVELFDEWVGEQRAAQACCDLEADRAMGRVA